MARRWVGIMVMVGAVAMAAATRAEAIQDSTLLRYQPAIGSRLHLATDATITTTVARGVDYADTVVIETAVIFGLTQQVLQAVGDRYFVRFTYDSLRARSRPRGGAWDDVLVPELVGHSVESIRDSRLRLGEPPDGAAALADTGLARQALALANGLDVLLPEGPVAPGAQWTGLLRLPATKAFSEVVEARSIETLPLSIGLTVSLDSLVPYGTDTLAYLGVRASFETATALAGVEGGGSTALLAGSAVGTLVWSRAWSAYVSGATRLRVDGAMNLESGGQTIPVAATWLWTIRHRLRQ